MGLMKNLLSLVPSPWDAPTRSLQELTSLSSFAQEVCPRLVREIEALPKEPCKRAFRGRLLLSLAAFRENLANLGHPSNTNDAKRVRIALNMLERLCQWPDLHYPNDLADSSFSPAWYPFLSKLLTNGECIREPLKEFFGDYKLKKARNFLTQLSDSLDITGSQYVESTLRGPGLSELLERRSTIEDCQDQEQSIVSLHNFLTNHCHCHCKQACDFMAANIRLNYNGHPPHRTNKVSKFNLLFQDLHNIQDSHSCCYWRDIEISVCATTTRVAFEENSDSEQSEESDDVSEGNDIDEAYGSIAEDSELRGGLKLCQYITQARRNQLQVKLIASNGELKLKGQSPPMRHFLTNLPSTSLAKLLQYSELTDRNKAILSYFLVNSIWQYYNCSWEDWNNKTVQFMSERVGLNDSSEVIFVNQPFLHARFNKTVLPEVNDGIDTADKRSGGLKKSHPAANDESRQGRKSHNYPKILALGIMLLEIQLGRKLESFKTPDYFDEDPNIAQHVLALDLLKDKKLWPPENTWNVIKEIIEICIDGNKTKAMLKNDSLVVRQKIYEQIVAPFRVFILEAWKLKGIEDVDPVTLEKTPGFEKDVVQIIEGLSCLNTNEQSLTLLPLPMMAPRVSEQKEASKPWLGGTMSTKLLESSEKWFENLDEFTEKLSMIGTRDRKNCLQIKVAILDTGITEEYYHELNEYIEEYKDFVSEKDETQQDGTGHGSTTLRLLLKLNSDVKVFVGRVFEHHDADDETERVMAKAIMHAKMEWKVDIICIPSGFNPDLKDQPFRRQLFDAVTATPKHDSDPKAIIFAAASNLGLKSEITYPGCLSKSSKVFCLFSTDGDGNPSGFNPAAVPNTQNFAMLGEGIRIDPMDSPIQGTSFSTIIAGAIAAYIMDFVNHPDTNDKILDVWSLREVEGMASVFASMVAVNTKTGYHILEPWRLSEHYRTRKLGEMELRQEICRNISRALRKRYSRG